MTLQLATRRIVTPGNRELETVARYLSDSVDQILRTPILNGRLVENVVMVAGTPIDIEHKLQRDYRGWIIVRKNEESSISELPTQQFPGSFIKLISTAGVTASFWVF